VSKVNVPIAFLSLVTSVLLWASVYNNSNPKLEKKDFVAALQPGNLDQRRFVISEIPADLTLTLTGNRDQLKALSPYAIVDLSMASAGVKSYPVVIFPASVREFVFSSSITARVTIENVTTKSFNVIGTHTGISPDGKQIESLVIFPKKVFVTGPEALVAKVATVQVAIDYSTAAVSSEGVEVNARALDSSGSEIPKLVLRTSDSHPEYTEEAQKVPATISVHLVPAPDPVVKITPKLP